MDCVISFSSQSGGLSYEGDGDRNSIFTSALLKCIASFGHEVDIVVLLERVQEMVTSADRVVRQSPWLSVSKGPRVRYMVELGSSWPLLGGQDQAGVTLGSMVDSFLRHFKLQVCGDVVTVCRGL